MATTLAAILAGALTILGLLATTLFLALRRLYNSIDEWERLNTELALKVLGNATLTTLLEDKSLALDKVISERDRLEFAVDTVEKQRDALLKESFKQASPGTAAIAVRNALERLRDFPARLPEEEALPDLPPE